MNKLNATWDKSLVEVFADKTPSESDYETLVSDPCRVVCEGETVIAYGRPRVDFQPLVAAVEAIKFGKPSYRTNGLQTNARSFGYTTRNVIRGDFCSASSLATELPAAHEQLEQFAAVVNGVYRAASRPLFENHRREAADKITVDATLDDGPFTTGNVNKNWPVRYHFDKGNLPSVWSGMIVLKRRCTGGYLSVPELRLGFELEHGTVFCFDGQKLLHGVTPFHLGRGGFRYSVVYFTLQQAWKCLPAVEELERIRRLRTDRERALKGRQLYAGVKPEIAKRLRARGVTEE